MTPAINAYNSLMFSLRESGPPKVFPQSWTELLRLAAFDKGHNILDPKFFDVGFSEAADPSFDLDNNLKISVSWVSDEAALQAVMGERLFGYRIDPEYGEGVRAFYDSADTFYWGAFLRGKRTFTSADTGGNGVVIGYNYLLSLVRLTELIGSPASLPAPDVQRLVDRALPVLQPGYTSGFSQIPYLWAFPGLSGVQWEYGMGKELSEAQLSYVCGLWWMRTSDPRYLHCEEAAIQLPLSRALQIDGASFLWGLDVVHGAYAVDALLLAYRTTGSRKYLQAALMGWRAELLFLFSNLDYPETSFDDRAMSVTSYYSTFADLNRGNYWRGDSWNNVRTYGHCLSYSPIRMTLRSCGNFLWPLRRKSKACL